MRKPYCSGQSPHRQLRTRSNLAAAWVLLLTALLTPHARAQDTNGNYKSDSLDLRNGTSLDCNHNGLIDDAETDRSHFSAAVEHLNALEQFTSYVHDTAPIDFNQDGRPDLAAISYPDPNYGYVTLWQNDGGLGLTYLSRFTLGTQLGRIVAVNIVGDARVDLVISDSAYTRVYVLRATGNATFATPITLIGDTSNNGHGGLAVGDVDNDGDIDIAASCWGQNSCNVWKNNGNGTFAVKTSTPVGYNPRGIAMGDVTGDGFADIAVCNSLEFAPGGGDGTVTILANSGTGSFSTLATYTMPQNTGPYGIMRPRPQQLALCDTDHDGDRDLIVSSKDSQRLDLWRNGGSGAFTLQGAIGAGYYLGNKAGGLLCADLDGDTWEEVAWTDTDAATISVYKNTAGVFSLRQHFGAGNGGCLQVTAADFDNDGHLDLVGSNNSARTFSILRNNGQLLFESATRFRPADFPSNALIADFDNDGKADLGMQLQTITSVTGYAFFKALGDGTFAPAMLTSSVAQSSMFQARDFNHDGNLDLIASIGAVKVYLGNGSGGFGAAIASPVTSLARHVVADFDGDTHQDLVYISPGHPGALLRALGNGDGTFDAAVTVAVVPAEDEEIAFGDITGDGLPEVFTGHAQGLTQPGGIFCVYPNIGGGAFGPREDRYIVAKPLSPAVGAIVCADFDGDKDNDVVISALGTRLFRNPGDGALPVDPIVVNSVSGSIYRADDFDLDGDIDILARAGTAIALFNDGTGNFPKRSFAHMYDSNARWMLLGDLNNDGRTDVVIEPENSWDKYIYLNRPPASEDCNGNQVPDPCDPDSNGDGIPNDCAPRSDFNGDGLVTGIDLTIMLAAWMTDDSTADVNSDGIVNAADLSWLLSEWSS